MSDAAAGRKRGNSIASSTSSAVGKKGRGERLLRRDRPSATVVQSFVNGMGAISPSLITKVSSKACQIQVYFVDDHGDDAGSYYGQAGLIKGERLTPSPSGGPENKRRRTATVSFAEYASFKATPVTAKHNLESENSEIYQTTHMIPADGTGRTVIFQDGGCAPGPDIEVRPRTEDTSALGWTDDDWSYGDVIEDGAFTKKPRLFEVAPADPATFVLRVGHGIAVVVYRTFDITNEDAGLRPSSNVDLEAVYGPKEMACIYTGKVTEISANGKTFCHDINTFEGCSGAVVFLLDQQPDDFEFSSNDVAGKAVGIHVGGLDAANNIAFLLGPSS